MRCHLTSKMQAPHVLPQWTTSSIWGKAQQCFIIKDRMDSRYNTDTIWLCILTQNNVLKTEMLFFILLCRKQPVTTLSFLVVTNFWQQKNSALRVFPRSFHSHGLPQLLNYWRKSLWNLLVTNQLLAMRQRKAGNYYCVTYSYSIVGITRELLAK